MVKLSLKIEQKGTVLIIAFIVTVVLMLLGVYFVSFTLTESKISRSQETATKNYFLAEAGINEAIWKLKKDDTTSDGDDAWSNDFIDADKNPYPGGGYWTATFSRDALGGSYIVTIENIEQGKGQITATSTIDIGGGRFSQRVVKTIAFKALEPPIDEPFYTGTPSGNSDIAGTDLNVYYGSIFVNNALNIKNLSNVMAENKVLAAGNLNVNNSNLTSNAKCASNICNSTSTCECDGSSDFQKCDEDSCPPVQVGMPALDFDSSDSGSYLSQAQNNSCSSVRDDGKTNCVFTSDEFENMLWDDLVSGNETSLSGVIYVDRNISLRGGVRLTVNGTLVAGGNVNIGYFQNWTKNGVTKSGTSRLKITDPGADIPSGLLTKRKIDTGSYFSIDTNKESAQDLLIEGLIYAQEEVSIIGIPSIPDDPSKVFKIIGGIVARKLDFDGNVETINIYRDSDKIKEGLWGGPEPPSGSPPPFSPVITIEHWEEEY